MRTKRMVLGAFLVATLMTSALAVHASGGVGVQHWEVFDDEQGTTWMTVTCTNGATGSGAPGPINAEMADVLANDFCNSFN